eukprot:445574_1
MSEEDGSYNDACDYYQRDEDSVTSIPPGNKLSGQGSLNPGQLRIGETMSIELDLLVNSECTQELGCDVIQIGSASDDYYPLVQLADGGMIQIKTKEYASDGTVEEKTYQSDTAIVTVGDYTRLSVVWTMNSLVVTYGDTVVINDVTNVRDHPADTTNYWDAPDKDTNGTFMHKMYAANEGADIAHANFKNLCIKTSWTPSYWKVMPTYCQAKQNMAAEAITALKGFDGHDDGDPWKNVRYGYIEFDRDGATVVTSLLKEEINKAPVSDEEMLDEFEMVQTRECGEGTDSETDLCEALQAAFDEFDAAGNVEADSFTPEREKKILIVSHNMDDGVCADGQSMCDKFAEEIRGGGENDHGVSVFMINIDVEAGTQGTYELCLVMGEEDRIDDIGTDSHLLYSKEGLNGGPSPNSLRDGVISMLQYELCQTVPTSNPTTDPTTNPTTPSPTTPSPTTPSPTTPSPTTPSPTTPSPTTPSPTTPSPTTPSPTTPSPTTPSPTTPSPTTPSPTTPSTSAPLLPTLPPTQPLPLRRTTDTEQSHEDNDDDGGMAGTGLFIAGICVGCVVTLTILITLYFCTKCRAALQAQEAILRVSVALEKEKNNENDIDCNSNGKEGFVKEGKRRKMHPDTRNEHVIPGETHGTAGGDYNNSNIADDEFVVQ